MNAQNECRVQTSLEQLRQSSPYWGDVKVRPQFKRTARMSYPPLPALV